MIYFSHRYYLYGYWYPHLGETCDFAYVVGDKMIGNIEFVVIQNKFDGE